MTTSETNDRAKTKLCQQTYNTEQKLQESTFNHFYRLNKKIIPTKLLTKQSD